MAPLPPPPDYAPDCSQTEIYRDELIVRFRERGMVVAERRLNHVPLLGTSRGLSSRVGPGQPVGEYPVKQWMFRMSVK